MKILKAQLELMLKRKGFVLSLSFGVIFSAVVYIIDCIMFFGEATFQVRAAKYMYLGSDLIDAVIFEIYNSLFPILAVLPFADTFFEEREQKTVEFCITRQSNNSYYFSKMLAVFISGFLIAVIPLLINYLLNFISFPLNSMIDATNFSKIQSGIYSSAIDTALFPEIFAKNIYLYNLIYLAVTSVTSGMIAVVVYQLSFFYKKSRVFLLISFFVVYNIAMLILSALGLNEFCIKNYMFAARFFTDMSWCGAIVTYSLLIAGCLIPIPFAKKRLTDIYD